MTAVRDMPEIEFDPFAAKPAEAPEIADQLSLADTDEWQDAHSEYLRAEDERQLLQRRRSPLLTPQSETPGHPPERFRKERPECTTGPIQLAEARLSLAARATRSTTEADS